MELGSKLGRYEIRKLIGSGGMGRVYLALDTGLDRLVALKVLLPEFVEDSARVKRFVYEAKAVSALNHPGIITIHEIVHHDDKVFIATEFVEGKTVRALIENGHTRELRQAVSIAEQVADALSVAHGAGIVHRDIKPENIMVRDDGIVKLLDFGLAKPIPTADSESLNKKEVNTQPGLVIGSVRYMSPEQARGKETDERTDIWSLGVVLHEMLTGENPFDGETVSDQLAAVIHKEPPAQEFETAGIGEILSKCLIKDRTERYRDTKLLARDLRQLRLELENSSGDKEGRLGIHRSFDTSENKTLIHRTLSKENQTALMNPDTSTTGDVRSGFKQRRTWIPVTALCLLLVGIVASTFLIYGFGSTADPFRDISVKEMSDDGESTSAAISPDGRFVAYSSRGSGTTKLTVQQVAAGTEVDIVQGEGGVFLQPTFTSDSDYIYYVHVKQGVGTLFKIAALGGEATKIAEDVDSRPSLSPDDKYLVFFRHDPKQGGDKVVRIDVASGKSEVITDTKKLGFDGISDIQHGKKSGVVYVVGRHVGNTNPYRVSLNAIDLGTGEPIETGLTSAFNNEDWYSLHSLRLHSADSGLMFIGKRSPEGNLQVWKMTESPDSLRQVTKDTNDYEHLSVSADLVKMVVSRSEWNSGLTSIEVSTQDTREIIPFNGRFLGKYGVAVSKKGQIIFPKLDGDEINLYSLDPNSGDEKKLTSASGINAFPSFSSDGDLLVYSSTKGDSPGLWTMKPDGSEKTSDHFGSKHARCKGFVC